MKKIIISLMLCVFLLMLAASLAADTSLDAASIIYIDKAKLLTTIQVSWHLEPNYKITKINVDAIDYPNGTRIEGYSYDKHDIIGYNNITDKTIIFTFYQGSKLDDALYDGSKITIWNYPIADRNFNEFGKCRQYEIDKNMCVTI